MLTSDTDTEEPGIDLSDYRWDEVLESRRYECVEGSTFEMDLIELDDGTFAIDTRYGSMKIGAHLIEKRIVVGNKQAAYVRFRAKTRHAHGYTRVK